jgi:hypothetical protein
VGRRARRAGAHPDNLQKGANDVRVPFLEPLVFLSHENMRCVPSAIEAPATPFRRHHRRRTGSISSSPRRCSQRKVLNVEGYAVLSLDDGSKTVALNYDLLRAQFDRGA